MNIPITSRCGLRCDICDFKEPCNCGGCIATGGHPFHGECPVARCCQTKGFLHCGECPELPCRQLYAYSVEDKEHGDNGRRIEQCRQWVSKSPLTPVIEVKESFQVLAMSRIVSTENCTVEIPEFWTLFFANGYQKIACGMFGICHHAAPDGKSFTYSIASPYDGGTPVPDGFEVLTVPAHTWAVFACVGPMPQAIQQMWPRIDQWLPNSGYEKLNDFDIELYPPGDLQSSNYESFIRIPVKRKKSL